MSKIPNTKPSEIERLQRDMEMFAYRTNINFITKWHNFTDSTYGAYLDGLDECLADRENPALEKKQIESVVEGYMKHKTRNFCFIMHMSNFEEISYLISKKEKAEIGSSSSIKRFSKGWASRTGKDLKTLSQWNTLTNAEKIRNCILHACERISLVKEKDREALRAIIKQENLEVNRDRIEISIEYLNKIKNAISEVINIH